MGALSEFGIAPQEDLLEASPATEANRLVEVEFGLLLRGPVAAAVDQVKRLSGVGQRDQQRMITPSAVIGDVDALLALGVGLDEGAIALDDRLGKELRGLLGPDPQPRFIDGGHQGHDIMLGEAAAEIPGGGGVGDPHGAQGVEIDLVVAPQLEVFDPFAPAGYCRRC